MSLAEDFASAVEDMTVPQLLLRNATEYGGLPALTTGAADPAPTPTPTSTPDGSAPPPAAESRTLTWAELRERAAEFSEGLVALGLEPGERLLIMMSSRPEHWIADYGAMHARAIPCTAYATLADDQIGFVAAHSAATVAVLEGADELERWRKSFDRLPDLRYVIVVDEAAVPGGTAGGGKVILPFSAVLAIGRERHLANPSVFEARWRRIKPDDPVAMMYTSGTTGDPKGVVLSHRNVLYQAVSIDALGPTPDFAETVAYLPLAHIAERMLSLYGAMLKTAHVHLCPDPTQVVKALGKVHPQGFFGVPRIWEKVAAGIQGLLKIASDEQREQFARAHALTLEAFDLKAAGKEVPADLAERVAEADRTVLAPIRALLGLDRVKRATSGAAPISIETLRFLNGLGIPLMEVWGLSETSGCATISTEEWQRVGSVGKAVPGIDLRTGDDGEVFVRGPIVLLGYLQADGTIDSPCDADGWMATGDVGVLDEDGFLTITDRKKELLITAAGKNIAPTMIESLLTAHPMIGYAVAVGDRRPYVTALIVPDPDVVAPEMATAPETMAVLEAAVQAANAKLARPEQVKRFAVVPGPWTPATGEVTPKLSLRRRIIDQRYGDVIESLYKETD